MTGFSGVCVVHRIYLSKYFVKYMYLFSATCALISAIVAISWLCILYTLHALLFDYMYQYIHVCDQ